ncbi:MAG: hypothetical protein DRQ37_04665 [Gammaproteobacteria bacterium]|nr:MAG: hypothetical protein DRQ37_04665 [Gammaproteobacteria bacterium]
MGYGELVEYVIRGFHASGVPGHKVCFQITETAAIINLECAFQLVGSLRGLGCKCSLDDFVSSRPEFLEVLS